MMDAQKSQLMTMPTGGMRGAGPRGGPPMMRGGVGRPGPYDRMQGPPGGPQLGRGYGVYGPNSRGSRSFKSKFEVLLI